MLSKISVVDIFTIERMILRTSDKTKTVRMMSGALFSLRQERRLAMEAYLVIHLIRVLE
jgi:hypothetical protein